MGRQERVLGQDTRLHAKLPLHGRHGVQARIDSACGLRLCVNFELVVYFSVSRLLPACKEHPIPRTSNTKTKGNGVSFYLANERGVYEANLMRGQTS